MRELRGLAHGRLGRRNLLIAYGVGLLLIIGITAGIAALLAPSRFLCQPYKPCGPRPLAHPLVNLQVWRSPKYGFAVEYPGDQLSVQAQGSSGVELVSSAGGLVLLVSGSAPSQSPSAAISAQLSRLQSALSGLATDSAPEDAIFGASVGFVSGAGAPYVGTLASSSGVSRPSSVAIQASNNGKVTLTATAVVPSTDLGTKHAAYQLADDVFNAIQWP